MENIFCVLSCSVLFNVCARAFFNWADVRTNTSEIIINRHYNSKAKAKTKSTYAKIDMNHIGHNLIHLCERAKEREGGSGWVSITFLVDTHVSILQIKLDYNLTQVMNPASFFRHHCLCYPISFSVIYLWLIMFKILLFTFNFRFFPTPKLS